MLNYKSLHCIVQPIGSQVVTFGYTRDSLTKFGGWMKDRVHIFCAWPSLIDEAHDCAAVQTYLANDIHRAKYVIKFFEIDDDVCLSTWFLLSTTVPVLG